MLSLPGDQSRNSLKLTVITAIPEEPVHEVRYVSSSGRAVGAALATDVVMLLMVAQLLTK